MKKMIKFVIALCMILSLAACEKSQSEVTNLFEQVEGNPKEGFSVKGFSWGMSMDEVKKAIPDAEMTELGNLRVGPVEEEDYKYCIDYLPANAETDKLVSVRYTYMAETEEAYEKIAEEVYNAAKKRMPEDTMTEGWENPGDDVAWEAENHSYVSIAHTKNIPSVSVSITGPLPVPEIEPVG